MAVIGQKCPIKVGMKVMMQTNKSRALDLVEWSKRELKSDGRLRLERGFSLKSLWGPVYLPYLEVLMKSRNQFRLRIDCDALLQSIFDTVTWVNQSQGD